MANYYDLDDIIAEEERVSVVFREAANGVGIDPSAETDCVEKDSKVQLPFWLAHELYLRQVVTVKVIENVVRCRVVTNQIVRLKNPGHVAYVQLKHDKTRLELGADSACVDLRSRCPYFYEFGCKIALLVGDKDLGSFLLSAFKNRYQEVLAKAHSAAFAAASKCLTLLTQEEATMYEAAQSSMAAFKKWRMGGPRFQKASILGRKRKPTD